MRTLCEQSLLAKQPLYGQRWLVGHIEHRKTNPLHGQRGLVGHIKRKETPGVFNGQKRAKLARYSGVQEGDWVVLEGGIEGSLPWVPSWDAGCGAYLEQQIINSK